MRKALIGMMLAATILAPVAAEAQRGNRGDGEQSVERIQQRNEAREQRNEARQQRNEARQQQAEQQQPQPEQRAERPRPVEQDAQRGYRGGGDQRGYRGGDRGGDRGRTQSIYPQAWQGDPNDPRLRNYQRLEQRNARNGRDDHRDDRRDWRGDRRDDRRDWRNDRRDDRRDWRGDRGDRRNWNRNWRNDRRYDWRSWRSSNRNIFRGSRYYSPYRSWNYSRFSIGFFLQPLFYSRNYWIGDPYQYRLPAAYPGTQWVRYYNDVVLVDVYTGEVLDVIHDFFW